MKIKHLLYLTALFFLCFLSLTFMENKVLASGFYCGCNQLCYNSYSSCMSGNTVGGCSGPFMGCSCPALDPDICTPF
jgi:hypothetical protein